MSKTRIEPLSHKDPSRRTLGSTFRPLTLAGATLATGLVAGVFYAYAVSVNLGLATQPDASYVATMQAINDRIENPLFFASFFGAYCSCSRLSPCNSQDPARAVSGWLLWPASSTLGADSC